jgi:hypothetical protein
LRFLVLATVALALIAAAVPGRLELVARVYALLVGGIGLVVAIRALRRADPPETPLRPPVRSADRGRPPSSLARLEQLATLGVTSSFDLRFRLAPELRSIAAGLLAARRRVDLEAEAETARGILGDETWEVVRPGRPVPQDRVGPGLSPARLTLVVESLERI